MTAAIDQNRIAYHPIRVTQHASLFLPYSEQELEVYRIKSLNTLRLSSPKLDSQLVDHHHQSSQIDSPPGYTTPSPFAIPLVVDGSNRTYSSNDPSQSDRHPSLGEKRPFDSILVDQQPQPDHSRLTHSADHDLTDHNNKRIRHHPSSDPPPAHNASSNSISQAVAQHYNSRPNLTKGARTVSPIFGLRKFNNWIKSVIIGKFASIESNLMIPLLTYAHRHSRSHGTKVLDLGCGKGGDLAKWQNAGVGELYGFDIARVSVEQAQSRYSQSCKNRFYAKFVALDCFSLPITSALSPEELREPFHAVSLQFCMHYAFETESKARMMLTNVSKFLAPGGVMIGTIPDPDLLVRRWEECSAGSSDASPSFGNSVYQIRFPYRYDSPHNQLPDQTYGNQYMFYLKDAVEDVPEYLVLWDPFVTLAREYGLKLIYRKGFHEIFETEKFDSNNRSLLSRMNVIDADGRLSVSSDQWDVSGIYLAFAFVKEP